MMKRSLSIIFLLAALDVSTAFGQAKPAPAASSVAPVLTVSGEVPHPLKLTPADLAKLPRHSVTAKDHDGTTSTFEGVALIDILRLAGMEFGEHLRGKSLALYLLVEAADGYQAVYALPELDPGFTDAVTILADRRDGKPLGEGQGPWRIIAPDQKRPARWVRQVIALTVKRA